MNTHRLIWKEIRHRWGNFLFPWLAIAVAVGYGVGSWLTLQTQQQLNAERVANLDDEIRKITLTMGFNINILPKGENLADFFARDFAEKTMPLDYVNRLAQSPFIQSIRHLRPALVRKADWPEQQRQIVLMGVSGVVPLTHADNPKKPLSEPVAPDTLHIGSLLANELHLQVGSETLFHGHRLKVAKIYPTRGSQDDITVWIDLPLAQNILQLPQQINLIQALECNCASIDRLAEIQSEISKVLGEEVQVYELVPQAIARAQAREKVRIDGERSLAMGQTRMAWQLVVLTTMATLIVGIMAMMNVRQRRTEIGILRALGGSSWLIARVFLTKALLLGILGGGAGCIIGWALARWAEQQMGVPSTPTAIQPVWPVIVLAVTSALTMLASWVPAIWATRQDPARVLALE